jgi:protein involved in polysaccharide export with SLBB domain
VGDLSTDRLRIGDPVSISFTGVENPPTLKHEERIKNDGRITLPFVGPIEAAGMTRGELQEAILTNYVPKYYKHLTVIVSSESRWFYVDGQVKNPGRFQHQGEMTVLKCIAAAGDFNDFAKKSKVEVTRSNGKKEKVNCIEAQNHSEKDLPVYPDDRIFVPRRYF